VAIALGGAAGRAGSAPEQRVHGLQFRVHVDLLDAGAGQDLAYWDALLDASAAFGSDQLEGSQGPVDTPCCVALQATSVTPFGSSGDGFDVIESAAEFDLLLSTFGEGSPQAPLAYVVLSLGVCDEAVSMGILGCALTPGDAFVVDVDDLGGLGYTIAHERGHNAGLLHPDERVPPEFDANLCRLMSASSGAGCLEAPECDAFRDAPGVSAGGACMCLGEAVGDSPLPDGMTCALGPESGVCSGGLCGSADGLAALSLSIGGGAEDPQSAPPDDLVAMSPLSGGWSEQAPIGQNVGALVFDPGPATLIAILSPTVGDDLLARVADDGAITPIGSLGRRDVVGLAWGPGAGFLYAAHVFEAEPGFFATDLLQVDPKDASVQRLGTLDVLIGGTTGAGTPFGGVQSLAYDADSDTLWGSTILGLAEIDPRCNLPGKRCSTTLPEDGTVERDFVGHFGLDFDAERGLLIGLRDASARLDGNNYLLGFLGELEMLDPASGETVAVLYQAFTGRSLALRPVQLPEPGTLLMGAAAAGALLALRSRSRRS